MKKTLIITSIVCLAISMSGCVYTNTRRADMGLQQTLSSLAVSDDFVVAASVGTRGHHRWGGRTCYIAQSIVAVGTNLPEEQAMTTYVELLVEDGWETSHDYDDFAELTRGENENMQVDTMPPSWMIQSNEDYIMAKDSYATVINVTISYYVPDRCSCLGE
jgi:hypothetical protein